METSPPPTLSTAVGPPTPTCQRPNPLRPRLCAQAVDGLLARHDWQLLDRAEFVRRAHEHLRGGAASDAQRAATHAYSLALHSACSGAEGRERQNNAYGELFRYLYDIALQR